MRKEHVIKKQEAEQKNKYEFLQSSDKTSDHVPNGNNFIKQKTRGRLKKVRKKDKNDTCPNITDGGDI